MEDQIRIATGEDAAMISELIVNTLRESNGHDYSPDVIEQVQRCFSPQAILDLLGKRQVYVVTFNQHIVATASLDHDVVRSVFVAPGCQGKGLGKRLMEKLESVAVSRVSPSCMCPLRSPLKVFIDRLGSTGFGMNITEPNARSSCKSCCDRSGRTPVGVSLLAIAVCQPTDVQDDIALSRAGSLPQ